MSEIKARLRAKVMGKKDADILADGEMRQARDKGKTIIENMKVPNMRKLIAKAKKHETKEQERKKAEASHQKRVFDKDVNEKAALTKLGIHVPTVPMYPVPETQSLRPVIIPPISTPKMDLFETLRKMDSLRSPEPSVFSSEIEVPAPVTALSDSPTTTSSDISLV